MLLMRGNKALPKLLPSVIGRRPNKNLFWEDKPNTRRIRAKSTPEVNKLKYKLQFCVQNKYQILKTEALHRRVWLRNTNFSLFNYLSTEPSSKLSFEGSPMINVSYKFIRPFSIVFELNLVLYSLQFAAHKKGIAKGCFPSQVFACSCAHEQIVPKRRIPRVTPTSW